MPRAVVKRALIFAAYVAIAAADAALGQSSTHVKTETVKPVPITSAAMTPTVIKPGWPERPKPGAPIPAGWKLFTVEPDKVVIVRGQGGVLSEHQQLFAQYRGAGSKVELHGPCYSACTVILTYVTPEKLCVAAGAFMAFHAVRSMEHGTRMDVETWDMYLALPAPVRRWIDRNGGHDKLPLDGYWTMYDRDLWAMGYPRCAP